MPVLPRHRDTLHAVLLLAPFLAINIVLLIYPFARGLWMSMHEWELLGKMAGIPPRYIGLENYLALFSDRLFWWSLVHTAEFTLLAVPTITVVGLILALITNRPLRSSSILRGLFFIPAIFSVSVVTLVWLMVLNPTRGLLGQVFQVTGLPPVDLLAHRHFALPSLLVTTLWWSVGLPMALFLAALQHISQDLYEAADLDHARPWTVFRHITLPAIKRTVWLVVILEVILQVQIFGQVLLMTGGGPANYTRVLVQHIYETSFRDWQVGYACAMSTVLFGVMLTASLLQVRLSMREG